MKSVVYSFTNDENYLEVLTCQIVRLIKNNQIIKMSKREGNYITLKDVYNSVGKDALRYFMISTKNETSKTIRNPRCMQTISIRITMSINP